MVHFLVEGDKIGPETVEEFEEYLGVVGGGLIDANDAKIVSLVKVFYQYPRRTAAACYDDWPEGESRFMVICKIIRDNYNPEDQIRWFLASMDWMYKQRNRFDLVFVLQQVFNDKCFSVFFNAYYASSAQFRECCDRFPEKYWFEPRYAPEMWLTNALCVSPVVLDVTIGFLFLKNEMEE